MKLTLARARRIPTGPVTYYAFDESNPRDFEALERLRRGVPDRTEARVEVDFSPATSAQLNRPARELVEAERDRLLRLLGEARALIDAYLTTGVSVARIADVATRIDAALPQQKDSAA